jgi:TRAP-type mannitol/chloroaromatic compound transport system permease small subunit
MTTADETLVPAPLPGGRVSRWLQYAALVLAVVGGTGTLFIMAMINADVVGRGAFGVPVPATAEIVSAMIVAIVFLQLPYATAAGRNVRADMLIGKLHARGGRSGPALDFFHHLVGSIMLAILLRYIWPEIVGSIRGNETVGLYGIFTLPRWPFITAVLIGCGMTLVQYVLLTLGFAQAAFGKGSRA